MLLNDNPFFIPSFKNARPSCVFPVGRLSFPGINIIQNTVEPSNIPRPLEIDDKVFEFVPDIFEISVFKNFRVLKLFKSHDHLVPRLNTNIIGIMCDHAEQQVEIFILKPANAGIDGFRDLFHLGFFLFFYRDLSTGTVANDDSGAYY